MSSSPRQEQAEWVRRFRESGEGRYFEKLYLSSRRVVFARCLRLLREEAKAEDVTHETFLRAYERFDDLRGENFMAWVGTIATNICLNRLRSARTRQRLEPDVQQRVTADSASTPESEMAKTTLAKRAGSVLEALGAEQRKVLLLKYLEGYSYSEITALTGFNHDRIRSLLQNGKRNFRIRWQALSGEGGQS